LGNVRSDLAGRIAESCVGYFFASLDIPAAYLPERKNESEVDFILTVGDHRIPVEVKYQRRIDPVRDVVGLRQFMDRKINRSAFGVVVTRDDVNVELPDNIIAIPLKSVLLAR
jgi:predicted AAA+ superfamily ATPase